MEKIAAVVSFLTSRVERRTPVPRLRIRTAITIFIILQEMKECYRNNQRIKKKMRECREMFAWRS
jgi:hypothetical protein